MKYVSPSVDQTAFNCPHCGALTTQFWYNLSANSCKKDSPTPHIINSESLKTMDFEVIEDEYRQKIKTQMERLSRGEVFLERLEISNHCYFNVDNLFISNCFNCKEIAIWVYDKLIYPQRGEASQPNPDLPPGISRDYLEASSILDASPRGAAALIRLAIQKLCVHLGKDGKNINDDIKSLVADGLDTRVQKALDIVRVVGNNAVHPGQIDLRDDRATAETLFNLLNLIAEKMISEPKHIDQVYDALPASARAQIEARDKKPDK